MRICKKNVTSFKRWGEITMCWGIGGLLRLVKSLFTPLVKSAGRSTVKVGTSNTDKAVLSSIKDQAIDSGIKLATDALRGEDMNESLQSELQTVKHKAADGLESVVRNRKRTSKQNGIRGDSNIDKQSLSRSKNIKRKIKQNQPIKQNKLKRKKIDIFD